MDTGVGSRYVRDEKGVPNTVEFTLVQTTAMKLEVVLPKDNSAGVFEWEVE